MATILIIDDDPSVTAALGAFFERGGRHVVRTGTAEEGIETFLRVRPDLVLLDLRLPDGSGFDVLTRLRSEEPVVIIITAHGEIPLAVQAMQEGAENFLTKPVDLPHLGAAAERALEKALKTVKDNYDYVLIDTPPSLGLLTINAFVAATGVIVPVQTEYLSLRGLAQLENTLAMVRENLNPNVEIIGIVPTMYDRRLTHSREADEILRENFGDLVYNTRIRKTVRFAEAPVKGTSVLGYEPDGEAAEMYRDLAKEVLDGKKPRKHA